MHAASLFTRLDTEPGFEVAVTFAIESAVAKYKAHRGHKDLATLIDYFSSTSIFPPDAVQELRNAADPPEGITAEVFAARFAGELPSLAMVEVIRGIAHEVTMSTLIDRLVKRLESDRDFAGVFRKF